VVRARILIADDHKEMRDKIVQHLETEFDIVDAVGTGREVLESVARMQPEICLLDISMPIVSGIEVAERMKACSPSTRVVFLTVHQDPDFVDVALKVGALGYVVKARMFCDLVPALHAALAGDTFVSRL